MQPHVPSRASHLSVVEFPVSEITSTSLSQIDIERGCDRNLKMLRPGNRRNNMALHEGIRNSHSRVIRLLIKVDSRLVLYKNSAGDSPLYLAARGGIKEIENWILTSCPLSAHDIVKTLLKATPELIKEADQHGRTPLYYALDISSAYAVDIDGFSLLHAAASNGHAKVIKEIIRQFPDAGELVDAKGQYILHVAELSGRANVVRCILETVELEGLINYQKLLMIAALITTVTFAAAFTLAGGYNNNAFPGQGVAFLRSSRHLKWFIISDTIVMTCSIMASSLILWVWGAVFGKRPYVHYYVIVAVLTCVALQSTAISFEMGLVAVLPDDTYVHTIQSKLRWFACLESRIEMSLTLKI
ncbi:hypothetical protein ACJRO7_023049 [Eucalyptus globulus]|uniref:PGG domain-containing protein n=1 Tax=Eucalyptus globulus TaxID=34317 RepID=A0ABD3KDD8_EUCGL